MLSEVIMKMFVLYVKGRSLQFQSVSKTLLLLPISNFMRGKKKAGEETIVHNLNDNRN